MSNPNSSTPAIKQMLSISFGIAIVGSSVAFSCLNLGNACSQLIASGIDYYNSTMSQQLNTR